MERRISPLEETLWRATVSSVRVTPDLDGRKIANVCICGTASEVNLVTSVDDRIVGYPGPIGTAVGDAFHKAVCGEDARYSSWVEVA